MQYLLVPELGAKSATAFHDLDLVEVANACMITALCSVDQGNPYVFDSAILFNLTAWKGHYLKMCAYGLVLCDEVSSRGLGKRTDPSVGEDQADIITGIMSAHAANPSERMVGPTWIYSPEVIKSHQRYLLHLNKDYADQWPNLTPSILPVPVTGPDVYATQPADI